MSFAAIPPPPRRSENVSVVLAAHFERLIATGELAVGSRLPPERELAAAYSVSRTSLREAMHELESKHLIARAPGRGTTILGPSAAAQSVTRLAADVTEQEHVAELRRIIEPSIAGLAAQRATAADLLALHTVLEKSFDSLPQAESLRLDVEFHLLLARAAQNPLLTALQGMASESTMDLRKYSHQTRRGRGLSIVGHRRILEAVEAHESAAAQAAMAEHLDDVRTLIRDAAH